MLARRSESIRMETRKGGEVKLNKKGKGNSTDYHEEVREFLLIGSLRRETEGIMK